MPLSSPDSLHRALAALGRLRFPDPSLPSVMSTVAGSVQDCVPGTSEASVTVVQSGAPATVASTGALAQTCDERQYARGDGPCLTAAAEGTVVLVEDLAEAPEWGDYGPYAARHGARSSLSVPVPMVDGMSAALNLYASSPRAFDGESTLLAATIAAHAGVALGSVHLSQVQADLAAQLQVALESRAVIDQAKGILMAARRCTAEEAFGILVDLSQRTNRKLRDVAAALVEEAVRGS